MDPPDSGLSDSDPTDAGLSELDPPDRGLSDMGLFDTGLSDMGLSNIGLSEVGLSDTDLSDRGLSNTGLYDTGLALPLITCCCVPVPLPMCMEDRRPVASLNVGSLFRPNGSCGTSLALGGGGLISLVRLKSVRVWNGRGGRKGRRFEWKRLFVILNHC